MPDDLNEEELDGKLALFDAVNGSGKGYLNEELNNTARSIGASEMVINFGSVLDLYISFFNAVSFSIIFC